jgi:hypothetical protein
VHNCARRHAVRVTAVDEPHDIGLGRVDDASSANDHARFVQDRLTAVPVSAAAGTKSAGDRAGHATVCLRSQVLEEDLVLEAEHCRHDPPAVVRISLIVNAAFVPS